MRTLLLYRLGRGRKQVTRVAWNPVSWWANDSGNVDYLAVPIEVYPERVAGRPGIISKLAAPGLPVAHLLLDELEKFLFRVDRFIVLRDAVRVPTRLFEHVECPKFLGGLVAVSTQVEVPMVDRVDYVGRAHSDLYLASVVVGVPAAGHG